MSGVTFYIPLDIATTPAEGHCFVNRWWAVHPEKGVAWWARLLGPSRSEEPSPQCNSDEYTARELTRRSKPDCEVRFLPAVYILPAVREMNRLSKSAAAERDAARLALSRPEHSDAP